MEKLVKTRTCNNLGKKKKNERNAIQPKLTYKAESYLFDYLVYAVPRYHVSNKKLIRR